MLPTQSVYTPYGLDPQTLQLLQLNRLSNFDELVRQVELEAEMELPDYEDAAISNLRE